MPGYLMHFGMTMRCAHQIPPVTPAPVQPRVTVSGQPVATATSVLVVAPGCPFVVPGPKPQPCVLVKWTMMAARVTVMGQPVLLQPGPGAGAGLCQSAEQAPQGPPVVNMMQLRVSGM